NELSTIYTMKANMDRLVRLLEQIVEFRKVETGNLKLKISEIEIVGFIKDLCDVSFMPLTTDKNISLHFETIPNEIVGYVDVDKLDKIIFNLLSNAFKYNKENGSVNVLIDTVIIDNQRHLLLKVSDNGYGMSETVKNNLFKRFYEGNFRDFKVKSIGIGLSLTHDLIEFHNGIISVESTEGIGSIFTISLPIDKECYDDSQIYLHTISNDEQNLQEDLQENSLVQTDAKFEKISVLIVEDNHELIQVMSEHLKAEFILSKAFNGEEALQILNHHKIDIVVTDILMPIMDGIELVNRMKSIVEYSHIPVLMISAKHNVEDKVEGFDAGADAYVIKPFEMPALIANIKSLVRNRRTLAQSFLLDPQQTNISKYAHNNTDKEFLEKVIKIIEDNVLEKNFITNDLYDALNISQSTLYRKLQVLIGISPNELIRKIRLKVASQLLLEDKLNISEIAYDLGFSDPKYFSIIFKKEIGVSPTEYKKTKRME
ncbi:MAG: response regulator, partial [Bacteroidia bacterium]|nr:response regulator [Bacteroidia bacterium]